jgi:hypothetical protein
MSIVLFSTIIKGAGEQLLKVIEKLVPPGKIEIYSKVDSLSNKLHQTMDPLPVAVLLISRKEELVKILSIQKQFRNVRIILILPDRKDDTIALAHRLRPRLLTYTDSSFEEVFAVLVKMLGEDYNA